MLYFGGLFGVLVLGVVIFAVVDVITTDDGSVRNLPKTAWLLLVLFFPVVGSIAWFVAGRPVRPGRARFGAPERRAPEHDRQGRFRPANPDDDEEFLRRCRERAEEQRRKGRENE
ncbi:Phospholipase_D-nuclease N-terminal [Lentzea xinjiangensis]|uniref:Phospholipase_D-nuclease N-terminal n=1 Tax=Lentzea xinjiangensis TaxID=402600 RepID=A0A1H9GAG2_9PSEU|nr:PLD nuclease N-terminal domain-containing protein [Lentzea xinjiangensis]SEQ47050.1 Phospholipase_D-nuclease N-terminal [Lentzea xinjiangensis]